MNTNTSIESLNTQSINSSFKQLINDLFVSHTCIGDEAIVNISEFFGGLLPIQRQLFIFRLKSSYQINKEKIIYKSARIIEDLSTQIEDSEEVFDMLSQFCVLINSSLSIVFNLEINYTIGEEIEEPDYELIDENGCCSSFSHIVHIIRVGGKSVSSFINQREFELNVDILSELLLALWNKILFIPIDYVLKCLEAEIENKPLPKYSDEEVEDYKKGIEAQMDFNCVVKILTLDFLYRPHEGSFHSHLLKLAERNNTSNSSVYEIYNRIFGRSNVKPHVNGKKIKEIRDAKLTPNQRPFAKKHLEEVRKIFYDSKYFKGVSEVDATIQKIKDLQG